MKTTVWINSITFSDNTKISFNSNDIVVFVGPNNAGKSASLKEALSMLRFQSFIGKVVKDLEFEKTGDESDLFETLESVSKKVDDGNSQMHYMGFGFDLNFGNARYWWSKDSNKLNDLVFLFAHSLNTEQRLISVNPANNIRLTSEPAKHPIHFLQINDDLESKFSDYFRQAFGTDLIVHRNAGSEVPLYVGTRPLPGPGQDRVSTSYIQELEKLDLLHTQGDGMRSFVGVLLNAFISYHSILFLDEPEAFLHPPQSRILGKMLGKDLPSQRQLFIATHSIDFLKGLLDSNTPNLKIIRIQRDGSVNKVSTLSSDDINNIWNDSLLRHSNILDGLFHSRVIICESDSDCRFFSALISAQFEDSETIAPDLLFIHCGGKHRIPIAVKALKKLSVDIRVVTDFDVLNDIHPLKDIFEDLGGDWNEIENDWNIIKKEVEQKRPALLSEDLKKEINNIIESTSERIFPKQKISEIQRTLKKSSAWNEAKEVGKAFIPSGTPTQAFERLQNNVKEKGLLILEVGELESFVKSVGNHGPKWVSEVLQKDVKTDMELETARKFVNQLVYPL